MSLNLNQVNLAGKLTRDPSIKFLADQKAVAEFGLAINRRWKSNGEAREETTFVDIEVWGTTAENAAKYLKKASGVYVSGRLKLDTWEDKNGGGKRSKLRVVADVIQFTDSKPAGAPAATAPAPAAPAPTTPPPAAPADEEPPF
jgi:single-strand DNA-binding protein